VGLETLGRFFGKKKGKYVLVPTTPLFEVKSCGFQGECYTDVPY